VMSLSVSSFASALLLDADSMPLANPEGDICSWCAVCQRLANEIKTVCPASWTALLVPAQPMYSQVTR
jgi:hypothetical protein